MQRNVIEWGVDLMSSTSLDLNTSVVVEPSGLSREVRLNGSRVLLEHRTDEQEGTPHELAVDGECARVSRELVHERADYGASIDVCVIEECV